MTIKQFFESKEKIAIHCDNEMEKIEELRQKLRTQRNNYAMKNVLYRYAQVYRQLNKDLDFDNCKVVFFGGESFVVVDCDVPELKILAQELGVELRVEEVTE